MDNLAVLEQQKDEADARILMELGAALAKVNLNSLKFKTEAAWLKTLAISIMNNEITRIEISKTLIAILDGMGTKLARPNANYSWWIDDDPHNPNQSLAKGLPTDFKEMARKIKYMAQEFSTQNFATSSLYKAGTIGHGILHALAAFPMRHSELVAYYPSINGASTLTHMRRQGVVEKEDDNQQASYVITELGREILNARGPYTFAMYKKYQGGQTYPKVTRLPWGDAQTREHFLKRYKKYSRHFC